MVLVPDVIAIPDSILEDAVSIIGQKAYTRAILAQLKLPTPKAFVVTSAAFYHFLSYENGLNKWRAIIDNAQALSPENMVEVARQLQQLVNHHPFDPTLTKQIHSIYHQQLKNDWAHITISPTPTTKAPVNFPLPIIKGETALIDFLRQMWSAQLTPHALSLQLVSHQPLIQPSPLLVSQHEEALVSGTITTIDPTTGNKNAAVIDAIYGTNPQADYRHIPGDIYVVDKTTNVVISRSYQKQDTAIVADRFGHYTSKKIAIKQQFTPKLNQQQINALVAAATKIHSHQLSPQIINWLITPHDLYFTRFRPYEAAPPPTHLKPQPPTASKSSKPLARGLVASPGIATAPLVRFVPGKTTVFGNIVILADPDINLIPSLRQAAGVVIESSGITSDLAIAARDLGIPTLVGTGKLPLKDNTVVTLDAINGTVSLNASSPQIISPSKTKTNATTNPTKTVTKLYISYNSPPPHLQHVYQQVAGIGFITGNDIVTSMGIHPKRIITRHQSAFTADFIQKLTQASHLMGDRPVIYHPIDLSTSVARTLEHGAVYEPVHESNSLFGFRGAFRVMNDPAIFTEEIKLLATLRNKHNLKNLHLCLPLIRQAKECIALKQLIATYGFHRSPSFKLYAKIGTVAASSMVAQLADAGLDGIYVDLDILTVSVLGYDPDSSEVDQELDTNHPAVINTLQQLIAACDSNRLPTIITGYRLNQSAELIHNVLKAGSNALLIDAPQFDQVNFWVAQAEAQLVTTDSKK